MKSKQEIRNAIAARRKSLDPQWAAAASERIVQNIMALEAYRAANTVGLYMAIRGEVQLDALFRDCLESGRRTCIPVFNAAAKGYEMAAYAPDAEWRPGYLGIREPVSPALVPVSEIDLMVVPGVAFDRAGHRLGRGKGYYDRLLTSFSGISVAPAYDFQVLPSIPVEEHDRAVNAVATEIKCLMHCKDY
jgi:5-formyltetrahydrofolate cyclo-ligase